MQAEIFLSDIDKAYDFLELSKEEFLQSYSYLTEKDYDLTLDYFNANKGQELAYLMRDAENMLLEEVTEMGGDNPYKAYTVTGEQLKTRVADYVYSHLTKEEIQEFEEVCNSMGC